MEPAYHSASYWDSQYSEPSYGGDWYCDYASIRKHLLSLLGDNFDTSILITGCGDSDVGVGLYDDGFKNVVNIDISPTVIKKMSLQKGDRSLQYITMDVADMNFANGSFDVVFDKACLDSLCTDIESADCAATALKEIHRVLRDNGWVYILSFAEPKLYFRLLNQVTWKSIFHDILHMDWGTYYLYRLQK